MAVTQKHMGRNSLIDRLAAQVKSRDLAIEILKKRGHLKADGKTLTDEGKARDAMTAEERAIDRAAKRTGRKPKEFIYKPSTNTAVLKNRK
jgi:homoaconitase/3-isopropylmalate dehydratase large subunit